MPPRYIYIYIYIYIYFTHTHYMTRCNAVTLAMRLVSVFSSTPYTVVQLVCLKNSLSPSRSKEIIYTRIIVCEKVNSEEIRGPFRVLHSEQPDSLVQPTGYGADLRIGVCCPAGENFPAPGGGARPTYQRHLAYDEVTKNCYVLYRHPPPKPIKNKMARVL